MHYSTLLWKMMGDYTIIAISWFFSIIVAIQYSHIPMILSSLASVLVLYRTILEIKKLRKKNNIKKDE